MAHKDKATFLAGGSRLKYLKYSTSIIECFALKPIRLKHILVMTLLSTSCSMNQFPIDYVDLATYSDDGHLQMVVEIPAGTNKKYEYDYETNTFPMDIKNGMERVIDFLGYPGNYGFIPSTMMDPARGGDGDALDILVLSEHAEQGTIIEVMPIGILVLEDAGEKDSKIIAVPIDKNLRTVKVASHKQFDSNYPSVKEIIELWFLNYKHGSIMEFKSWENEAAAKAEIEQWLVTK